MRPRRRECTIGPVFAHRFGRSRKLSAPPAARTALWPLKARTPARPDGALRRGDRRIYRSPLRICGLVAAFGRGGWLFHRVQLPLARHSFERVESPVGELDA